MTDVGISIDLFHPASYRHAPWRKGQSPAYLESYEHDADHLYFVLQPMVLVPLSNATVPPMTGAINPISLTNWFKRGALQPGQSMLLAEVDGGPLREYYKQLEQQGLAMLVPVPLPLQTKVTLKIIANDGSSDTTVWWSDRVIGAVDAGGTQASPFLLPVADWPYVAGGSFIQPLARTWGELWAASRSEVRVWLRAAVVELLQRKRDKKDWTTRQEHAMTAYGQTVMLPVVTSDGAGSFDEWIDKDLPGDVGMRSRGAAMYDELVLDDAADRLHAPRFRVENHPELGANNPLAAALLAQFRRYDNTITTASGVSYAFALWNSFREYAAVDTDETAQHLMEALARFYGFGERLVWKRPGDIADVKDFMVCQPDWPKAPQGCPPAFQTNAASLSGFAFRVPLSALDVPQGMTLRVSLAVDKDGATELVTGQAADELSTEIALIRAAIPDWTARTVRTHLSHGSTGDAANGLVFYQARAAQCLRIEARPVGSPTHLYQVPEALLDLVDKTVRREIPDRPDVLMVEGTPRRALFRGETWSLAETLKDKADDGTDVTRELHWRLHALLTRLPVSGIKANAATPAAYRLTPETLADDSGGSRSEKAAWPLAVGYIPSVLADTRLWLQRAGGMPTWISLDTCVVAGRDGALDIVDPTGALAQFLPPAEAPAAPSWKIDLIVPSPVIPDLPFNLIAEGRNVPWIALGQGTLTRVSRSNDRWYERVSAQAKTSPEIAPDADLIAVHLSNFNKLRLVLLDDDEHQITYPDALVPLTRGEQGATDLPWVEPVEPGLGDPFSYFVTHSFAQQIDTRKDNPPAGDTDPDRSLIASEALRYSRYGGPTKSAVIAGYLEHQYGYRIPVVDLPADEDHEADGFGLESRLASDLRNAGDLTGRKPMGEGQDGATADAPVPLLRAGFGQNGDAVEVAVDPAYVHRALLDIADDATKQQKMDRVDAKRTIYEAVDDTLAAIDAGGLTLRVDFWSFDNRLPGAVPGAMGTGLWRRAIATRTLGGASAEGQALAKALAQLAPPSFAAFNKQVEALAADPDALPPTLVSIPLKAAGWTWDPAGTDPDALIGMTTAARVALEVTRVPARIVAPEVADGRYLFIAADPKEHQSPLPAWLQEDPGNVIAARAQEETKAYFASGDTSLRWRRSWLGTAPPKAFAKTESAEKLDSRYRVMFGEVARTLSVLLSRQKVNPRVGRLFYAPFAAAPLAAHPAIGETLTGEFVNYLVGILADLVSGADPAGITIDRGDAAAGYQARILLEKILARPGGVGEGLADTMAPVHNPANILVRPDGTPWDDATLKLVNEVLLLIAESAAARRERQARVFAGDPGSWLRNRAFGDVILEPTFDSDVHSDVHSMEVVKAIRLDRPTRDKSRFVVSRDAPFGVAPRFVIDPLDGGRYDAEFEIRMNAYRQNGAIIPPGSLKGPVEIDKNGVTLAARGDACARTGEAIIEDFDPFVDAADVAEDEPQRSAEVEVVHWNPHWRTTGDQTQFYYVLPSRYAPIAPVGVSVRAASDGRDVSRTPLVYDPQNAKIGFDFAKAIDASLGDIDVDLTQDDVQPGGRPALWTPVKNHPWRAKIDATAADGWWRVDSWLEHHYFVVEAGEFDSADKPFANDRIECDVDLLVPQAMAAAAAQPKTTFDPASNSDLYNWFRYDRARRQGLPQLPPQPAPMRVGKLVDLLELWLTEPDYVGNGAANKAELGVRGPEGYALLRGRGGVADPVEPPKGGWRVFYDPGDATLMPLDDHKTGIGAVVATDLFASPVVAGNVRPRYLLRVSVLAEPWTRQRVRARIRRNERDVDGGGADINPAFVMISPASAWQSQTRGVVSLEDENNGWVQWHVPASERQLNIVTTKLATWLARDHQSPPSIGTPFSNRVTSTFEDPQTHVDRAYWNSEQMLSEHRNVSVALVQRTGSAHVLGHAGDGLERAAALDSWYPRRIFGAVPANTIDGKLDGAADSSLTAGAMYVDVTWLDRASQMPVYRIVWPLRFRE